MTFHPSYMQIGHFVGRETVYCNLNSNKWGRGLSCSRCQGRETVYLYYDFRRFSKAGEIGM